MLLRAQEFWREGFLSRRSFLVGTGAVVATVATGLLSASTAEAAKRSATASSDPRSRSAKAKEGAKGPATSTSKTARATKPAGAPATKSKPGATASRSADSAGNARGHRSAGTRLSGGARHRDQRSSAKLARGRRTERRHLASRVREPEVEVAETVIEQPLPADRSLDLYCLNTGERLSVDYCRDGFYQARSLRRIDELLRDHRNDEVHEIDPAVLDLLLAIRTAVGSNEELHVVSGYRSPQTNRMRFLAGAGVAEHSYHIEGRAVDFFLPDRPLRFVHRTALALKGGGVGYYPGSGFVHVDNGPLRYW